MKILGIIPARFDSTRLPGKALAEIGSKPMIQHVYERASAANLLDATIVATDDSRIERAMASAGIPVIMTSKSHRSGTERCNEACSLAANGYDYVINIQGDEPFIDPSQIDTLAKLCDGNAEIATLLAPLTDPEGLHDPNVVKVVKDLNGRALYFSRSPIPYLRDHIDHDWTAGNSYWKHIGMYAYRTDILGQISQLETGKLESVESLEQLRWLEHGYSIITGVSEYHSMGVDTPHDLERARRYWENKQI